MEKKFWTPTSGVVSLSVILGWIKYLAEKADAVLWDFEAVADGPVGTKTNIVYTFNRKHFLMGIERVA